MTQSQVKVTERPTVIAGRMYHVTRDWGTLPCEVRISDPSHLAVDSKNFVYVFQRTDPPIVVLDPNGDYARSWGNGQIMDPHGICIDSDDRVWVVDRDAHEVMRFTTAGTLEMSIGTRHLPSFQQPFNHPSGIASSPSGNVYITDGYGNHCVHCFSPDGRLLMSWGAPGSGPGQFSTPHAVCVTRDDRVLVADRENNRIQVFSESGEYITEWRGFYHPMDIWEDGNRNIVVTDQVPRMIVLDRHGTMIGSSRPALQGAHSVTGDSQGNMFVCELSPVNVITKLTPA